MNLFLACSVRFEEFPDSSEIEFDKGDWILELVVLNDLRVENADGSNGLAFEKDVGASLWEELSVLLWISVLTKGVVLAVDGADLGHEKTQSSMNDLEGSACVELHETNLSDVLSTGITLWSDLGSITDFKDLLWNTLILV